MYLLNGNKIKDNGFQHGDVQYPPGWIALATPAERHAIGISVMPDPVRPDSRLGEIIENPDGTFTQVPWGPGVVITAACDAVDNAVSEIYTRWTRFEKEYTLRLAAAKQYIDAGYAGPVSSYLSSVATAADIPLQEAADQIIEQAEMFDMALEQLAAARMRKFEIKRAESPEAAIALQDSILQQVKSIAARLT